METITTFEKLVLQRLAQKTLEARVNKPAPEPLEEPVAKDERLPYDISKHVQEMKRNEYFRKQHRKMP